MDIKEGIKIGLQELILPELSKIREENMHIKAILELTNKRLDDINQHLADQSRRIDDLRIELRSEIVKTNERIDRLYEVIVRRDEHNKLEERVLHLEEEVKEIKIKLVA